MEVVCEIWILKTMTYSIMEDKAVIFTEYSLENSHIEWF